MAEKSFVGLGFTVCPFCGKENEENCVLLDSRMKNTLDRRNFMGFALCEEHKAVAKNYDAVCLFALDRDGDSIKLHDGGLIMPLDTFRSAFKVECEFKPGDIAELEASLFDKVKADAAAAGAMKEIATTPEVVNA